jgi:hypothetical protein
MDPKTLPTIWGTNMKLVTKYQIHVINSCWEKCDEKCAYMFNVYKNQLSLQTGSRNLTGPKTLPTIWHTYMKLVTKKDRRTEVKQYTPFPLRGAGVYLCYILLKINGILLVWVIFGVLASSLAKGYDPPPLLFTLGSLGRILVVTWF